MVSDDLSESLVPKNLACWLLSGRYSVQVGEPISVSGADISVSWQAANSVYLKSTVHRGCPSPVWLGGLVLGAKA